MLPSTVGTSRAIELLTASGQPPAEGEIILARRIRPGLMAVIVYDTNEGDFLLADLYYYNQPPANPNAQWAAKPTTEGSFSHCLAQMAHQCNGLSPYQNMVATKRAQAAQQN